MSPFWSKKPAEPQAETFTPFKIEHPAVSTPPPAPSAMPSREQARPNGHRAGEPSGTEWVVAHDGSGDFTTIGEAIAAAGSQDLIRIRTGHYLESLSIDKPVHLLGEGGAIDLGGEPATPNAVFIGSDTESVVHWTADDGSMRNILLVNYRDPDTTPVSEFRYGISLAHGNVELERCVFVGVMSLACRAAGQSRVTMRGCVVDNECTCGLSVYEQGSLLLEESDLRMEGVGYAVHVSDDSTATIRKNTVAKLVLVSAGTDVIEDNVLDSLSISEQCNAMIRRNQITGMVQISGGRPILEDNDLGAGSGAAVWIKEDANPILRRNRLTGSMILQDLGGGITIGDRAKATIEENTFRDCQGAAFICSDSASPVLKRNTFSRNEGFAVMILGGKPLFEDNTFTHNTTNAVIRVTGAASRPVFRRNKIAFNSSHALAAYDGANVLIERNEITRNGGTGVAVLEGGFAEVIDNQITGNERAVTLLGGGRGVFKRNDFTSSGEQSVGIDEQSMLVVDADQIVNENRLD